MASAHPHALAHLVVIIVLGGVDGGTRTAHVRRTARRRRARRQLEACRAAESEKEADRARHFLGPASATRLSRMRARLFCRPIMPKLIAAGPHDYENPVRAAYRAGCRRCVRRGARGVSTRHLNIGASRLLPAHSCRRCQARRWGARHTAGACCILLPAAHHLAVLPGAFGGADLSWVRGRTRRHTIISQRSGVLRCSARTRWRRQSHALSRACARGSTTPSTGSWARQ